MTANTTPFSLSKALLALFGPAASTPASLHVLREGVVSQQPRPHGRVRDVLCLFANPDGETCLRLDRERRAIDEANQLAGNTLRIASCWATRAIDLVDRLLEGSPNVIHFAGHGERGEILLEDFQGYRRPVEIACLLEVLAAYRPRCVLLNACHSAEALRTTAGIPYVIAMQGTCSDEGSIGFSRSFYRALAQGCSIEAAYAHACRALRLSRYDADCRPRLLCSASATVTDARPSSTGARSSKSTLSPSRSAATRRAAR